jgi:hypothetical protein
MPRLQILLVENCPRLDSLPSELWSLTTLRKVCVRNPSDAMAAMLQNLEVNNGCELIVEKLEQKHKNKKLDFIM